MTCSLGIDLTKLFFDGTFACLENNGLVSLVLEIFSYSIVGDCKKIISRRSLEALSLLSFIALTDMFMFSYS